MLNKQIIFFILKAIGLYVVWYLIYDKWLIKVGWIDNLIINNIIDISKWGLEVLGYRVFLYQQTIGIDGSHGVFIGLPCDGMDLMALFAGFIILLGGKWFHKIIFITSGLVIIHILNVIRVFGLILLANYYPESIEFNHKYTFTILMYIVVFLGWMIWVKKYATLNKL